MEDREERRGAAAWRFSPAFRGPWPDRVRFWALLLALLSSLVLGGSARADVPGLLLLRPLLIVALLALLLTPGRWEPGAVRTPLLLLAALALLMLAQLLPLPPGLWNALPGRELHAEAAAAAGIAEAWRPLSLAPYLTMNSLLALLPAAVAMLGMARLRDDQRRAMLPLLIGVACASALLGIVQLTGAPDGPAYFYEITHSGSAVGFFANRNHQAALLALAFPMLRVWTLQARGERARYRFRLAVAAATGLLLVPMLVATGSRLGVLLGLIGIAAALLLAPLTDPARRSPRARLLVAAAWLVPLASALAAIALGRGLAIERIVGGDLGAEPRLTHLPVLLDLLKANFAFGTGFGTFDPLFRNVEPDWALSPRYFNHAHNEPIELLLSGGIPALLILLGFLLWWGRRAVRAFAPARAAPIPGFARLGLVMIAMLLFSSLVEYALRTPLMGMIFGIACAWAAMPARRPGHEAEAPSAPARAWPRFLPLALGGLAGAAALAWSHVVTAQLVARPGTGASYVAWPGGGSAQSRVDAATALLMPGAAPGDVARARALAEAALVQEPANAAAARTLAMAALLQDREGDAARLFAIAERLSRRDLPTQLWLIEDRVRRNDVAGALLHYDRALRASPESHALLLPVLVDASAAPGIAPPLARLVARQPYWAKPFAIRLFRDGRSPGAVAAIALALDLDPGVAADVNLLRRAEARLAALNAPALAWRVHSRMSGGARAAIRNGGFEDVPVQSPFDWSFSTPPPVAARAGSVAGHSGLALLVAAESGHGGEAARQLLALEPGAYALGFTSGRLSGDERPRLLVRIRCAGTERDLLAAEAAGGASRQAFTVPEGCTGQWLSIAVAPERGDFGRAEFWIDALTLAQAR